MMIAMIIIIVMMVVLLMMMTKMTKKHKILWLFSKNVPSIYGLLPLSTFSHVHSLVSIPSILSHFNNSLWYSQVCRVILKINTSSFFVLITNLSSQSSSWWSKSPWSSQTNAKLRAHLALSVPHVRTQVLAQLDFGSNTGPFFPLKCVILI